MISAATICGLLVLGVCLRLLPQVLPRPAAELAVDALYAIAQRCYAGACAADRALVAYRTTRRQAEVDTVREYRRLAEGTYRA